MKPIQGTITKLSLAVMLLAGLAQAQFNAWVVNVNVPFEFTVGKKTFPAGRYSLVRTAPYRLSLRDSRQGAVALVMTVPVQTATPRAEPTLVFRTEGGEHVLIRVWFANSPYGNELAPTKPRLAMAKVQAGDQAGQP